MAGVDAHHRSRLHKNFGTQDRRRSRLRKKNASTDEQDAFIISESCAKMIGYTDPEDATVSKVGMRDVGTMIPKKRKAPLSASSKTCILTAHQNVTHRDAASVAVCLQHTDAAHQWQRHLATISHLEDTWKKFESNLAIEYKFLDSNFDKALQAGAAALETVHILYRLRNLYRLPRSFRIGCLQHCPKVREIGIRNT